jgi:FAD synthase
MHQFKHDFYGHHLKTLVLGYIRPELDYTSRGQLHLALCSFRLLSSESRCPH